MYHRNRWKSVSFEIRKDETIMTKETKTKKIIAPNEASFGRWLLVLLVGFAVGCVLSIPLSVLAQTQDFIFFGIHASHLFSLLTFVPIFWCIVFAIKILGKTSLKDFVLGVGGKLNKKECLTVFVLYALGFAIHLLPSLGNIRLHGVKASEFGFLVLFCLLVTWMQTSAEELVYRGLVSRWVCKNQLGYTKKAVIAGIITSLLFAVSHATNPEVTSLHGFQIVLMLISYAVPGLVCYLANLHFGNLMPGIIMHFTNNFLLFTLISGEVSALPFPTLLVDASAHSGGSSLLSVLLTNLPILVYMIVTGVKRKKALAAA